MSGRIALRDSIKHAAQKAAERNMAVRRGTVTALNPITVELHSFAHELHADNDLALSQWAQFYDHAVGIAVDDMVLVQQEGSDWVLVDVVSHKNAGSAFDAWRAA